MTESKIAETSKNTATKKFDAAARLARASNVALSRAGIKLASAVSRLGAIKTDILKNVQKRNAETNGKNASGNAPAARDNKVLGTASVTCSALNVRADASAQAARIGGVVKGQNLSYYEVKDGWLKIAYGAGFGWVDAKYTSYKAQESGKTDTGNTDSGNAESGKTDTGNADAALFKVKVTADIGLNVRAGIGTSYDILGALECNTVVDVLAEQDGWYKINYNGSVGWISAKYTEKVDGSSGSGETAQTQTKTVVTTADLNLRDVPGSGQTPASGSNVLTTIPNGTSLTVSAEQNGWYKVSYGSYTGWCCAAYTAEPPKPSDNALADLQKVIDKARSFVRNPHHPYVWGGKGQIMNKTLIDRLNGMYPGKYSAIYANASEYFNGNYRAFDCSGLCCWCYKNELQRDISEGNGWQPQSSKAVKVMGKEATQSMLQIGDVISSPGHFVMYRGEGKAVESCGSKGLADDLAWNRNGCDAVYRYLT